MTREAFHQIKKMGERSNHGGRGMVVEVLVQDDQVDEDMVHQDNIIEMVVQEAQAKRRSMNLLHAKWVSNN